jgi:hypothetical protein
MGCERRSPRGHHPRVGGSGHRDDARMRRYLSGCVVEARAGRAAVVVLAARLEPLERLAPLRCSAFRRPPMPAGTGRPGGAVARSYRAFFGASARVPVHRSRVVRVGKGRPRSPRILLLKVRVRRVAARSPRCPPVFAVWSPRLIHGAATRRGRHRLLPWGAPQRSRPPRLRSRPAPWSDPPASYIAQRASFPDSAGPLRVTFLHAFRATLWVSAAVALLAAVVSLTRGKEARPA